MNSQRQKLKQQQKLTPQQLLLMRLLQLPATRLEQKIKEEVEKNPMLEIDGSDRTDFPEQTDYQEPTDTYDTADPIEDEDFKGIDIDQYYDDDDYSYRERLETDRNVEEHRYDYADGISFTQFILDQFNLRNISEQQRIIGNELIGSIDGSGYLGRDIQLIANDLAFRSGMDVSEADVEQALHIIQSLDPAGVGARTLQECLSLQIHRIQNPDASVQLATAIIDHYFNQLSNHHYASLMTSLKIDEKQLNEALAVIQRLNPKPGWGREEENKGAHYIIPDFIVSREGGQLSFKLSDHNRPKLHLSDQYADLLQELYTRKKLNPEEQDTVQFIKTKTEAAKWLIDTLTQRQQTLSTVMEAILNHQRKYFLSGDSRDLVPMRLKDVAALTHYDESTISRVVNEKYVQTEFGTFLLKEIFSKAVQTEQGDTLVIEHLKESLQHIIDNEDKRNPLTDEELTMELQSQGFRLSRRTVAKYRESMGIPVGRLRKEI